MTDHELEARLSQAVRHAAPNDLDGILSRCKDRKGNVIPMTETTVKKNRKVLPWLAAAACLLLAIGFGFQYQQMNAVASVVSLDVNPSVVLSVNNKEKVLEARAANLDAEEILEGMDLKGTDLNVAINAIVGSLLKHGYVDELANSILITVEDDDAARGSALQAALTTEVNDILTSASVHAAILSQTVGTDDAALQEKADQYGITLGKATLIQSMVDQNSQLTFEELAPLSVNELNLLASNPKNEPTAVTSTGAASDEAYIGVEGAKEAAFAHAGLSASEVSMGEVDFDYEDGRMVYELEFYAGGREYEYDVDASTGAIVKSSYEGGRAPSQAPSGQGSSFAGSGSNASSGSSGSAGQDSGSAASTAPSTAGDIGSEAAKAAAFQHAGVSASQVTDVVVERDYDDGRLEYSVDFWVDGVKYDYEIDGADGSVRKSEREGKGAGTSAAAASSDIGSEAAKTAAFQHAGVSASQVTDAVVEKDWDDGRLEYKVDFWVGNVEYEYEIDATTGGVRKSEKETHASAASSTIGADKAQSIALAQAGLSASQVRELEVDAELDERTPYYEVSFKSGGMEYEYKIAAADGSILAQEKERD